MYLSIISFIFLSFSLACTSPTASIDKQKTVEQSKKDLKGLSKAYFASGCFWCVEAVYESVEGVAEAVSGYSGGKEKNPTYQQVSAGRTGHAEAVEVYYDPAIVSYETMVKVFFGSHDPTTANQQGPDRGSQYRSMIYFQNPEEEEIAKDFVKMLEVNKVYSSPIVTEIVPLDKFWIAEEYHQDYEKRNPNQPYVKSVSIPRLKRFQAKFPELLKKDH